MSQPGHGSTEKRRAGGAIRVPFVRRCQLDYEGGSTDTGFIVNINSLGAYVAHDRIPPLGRAVVFHFQLPGSEREVAVDGIVAWVNPQQDHPVHSLPPGFGIAFRKLSDDSRERIDQIVADYLSRQSAD